MGKNYKWVYLSVYYDSDSWDKFISVFLINRITDQTRNPFLNAIFHFDTFRGDYIGLSMPVENLGDDWIYHNGVCSIQTFIKDNPSKRKAKINFPTPLFMDFPCNSIQHSLHSFLPCSHNESNNYFLEFWKVNSANLLKCVNHYKAYSFDNLFTLALHINITLMLKNNQVFPNLTSSKFHKDQNFEKIWLSQQHGLLEIKKSCLEMLNTTYRGELSFLFHFINELQSLIESKSSSRPDNVLFILQKNTRQQLGVFGVREQLFNYFMMRLFSN